MMKKRAIVDSQNGIEELESLNSDLNISDLPYVIEQVPETWKELKKLALTLPKNKQDLLIRLIPPDAFIKQERLEIYRKGCGRKYYSVATFYPNIFWIWSLRLNASIPEMWDFIKSILKVGGKYE